MDGTTASIRQAEQVALIRDFNRFYTARLGLLRKRYLNGAFSLTEGRILYEIWSNPPLTAANLCGILKLDAGYISRNLASLGKRKLVRQKVSKLDGRERSLSLTSTGQKAVSELNRQSSAQIADLLRGLDATDRETLVTALAKVRSLLAAPPNEEVRIVRLSELTDDARDLLQQYFESIAVVVRDTPDDVRRVIEDPNGGGWIAYLNGKAVGCVYLRGLASLPDAAECKRLFVKPSARGNGVAHALLDAQEAFAKSRGFKQIYLDSKDDLKIARDLYARRGFVACDRYNDNPQATIFMVKTIAGDRRSGNSGERLTAAVCERRR